MWIEIPPFCDILALGEPLHSEPAFGYARNELARQLPAAGFRSIALEIGRVAALAVDDHVRNGTGSLDDAMAAFSHGWGEFDANRALIAWMREHNATRPPDERLALHGFDSDTENYSAPSPRTYLEKARDHLGLDIDIAGLAGDDERWSRAEAVLDPAASPGATEEAARLREIGDTLLAALEGEVPGEAARGEVPGEAARGEIPGEAARGEIPGAYARWQRARIHLTTGLGLLRYHRECAKPIAPELRMAALLNTRDALIAANLLDIRAGEQRRGPTLVFGHNAHLQRRPAEWGTGTTWIGAGMIVGPLLGDRYTFIAGTLGRSDAIGLGAPAPDTYEGSLRDAVDGWGITTRRPVGTTRTDTEPRQGYFPLSAALAADADAFLHVTGERSEPARGTLG